MLSLRFCCCEMFPVVVCGSCVPDWLVITSNISVNVSSHRTLTLRALELALRRLAGCDVVTTSLTRAHPRRGKRGRCSANRCGPRYWSHCCCSAQHAAFRQWKGTVAAPRHLCCSSHQAGAGSFACFSCLVSRWQSSRCALGSATAPACCASRHFPRAHGVPFPHAPLPLDMHAGAFSQY